jgi:phosphomethylpyrimidine synthase
LWDRDMAGARKALNWEKQIALSLDRDTAKRYRDSSEIGESRVCTMCGEYCAIKQIIESEQG